VFKVEPAAHAARRAMVGDTHEHGGNFSLGADGLLHGEALNEGSYNRIQMTRGYVDWHSHPRNCESDEKCALGIPSPQDVMNVVLGAVYGSLGHLVYAKEGCYLIQLRPALVSLLRCDYKRLDKFTTDLTELSDHLHKHFLKRLFPYKDYIKYWLKLMTVCGITVKFFAGDAQPKLTLNVPTGTGSTSSNGFHAMYKVIKVPVDVEHDPDRLAQCSL
jgi:hypothetical protein